MSAYEGSKMQERDEDRKSGKLTDFGKKNFAEKLLNDPNMNEAIKNQKEKMADAYINASKMKYSDWCDWMESNGFFIGKF